MPWGERGHGVDGKCGHLAGVHTACGWTPGGVWTPPLRMLPLVEPSGERRSATFASRPGAANQSIAAVPGVGRDYRPAGADRDLVPGGPSFHAPGRPAVNHDEAPLPSRMAGLSSFRSCSRAMGRSSAIGCAEIMG